MGLRLPLLLALALPLLLAGCCSPLDYAVLKGLAGDSWENESWNKTMEWRYDNGSVVYSETDYDAPVVLHRTIRNCSTNSSIGPEQVVDLTEKYVYTKCSSRYYDHCIADRSFDTFYDDWCEYANGAK